MLRLHIASSTARLYRAVIRFSLIFTICASLIGIGCSAHVADSTESAGTAVQKLAVLEVQVQQNSSDTIPQLTATARFASIRDTQHSNQLLQLLGLTSNSMEPGICRQTENKVNVTPSLYETRTRVDLHDRSPVTLELKELGRQPLTLQLEPHAFPDVVGLVSGVVFVARSPIHILSPSNAQFISWAISNQNSSSFDLPSLPQLSTPNQDSSLPDTLWLSQANANYSLQWVGGSFDRLSVDVIHNETTYLQCEADAHRRIQLPVTIFSNAKEVALLVRAHKRWVREDSTFGQLDIRIERTRMIRVRVQ